MAADVRGIEPLAGNVDFQMLGKGAGDCFENVGGQVFVAEDLLIAFKRSEADIVAGIDIQGIFDVDSELKVFDGLEVGPVEEVGEEDKAGHGIELLGGGSGVPAEFFGQLFDGHFFEEDVSEEALP